MGCLFLTVLLAGASSITVVFECTGEGFRMARVLNLSEFSIVGMRLKAITIP